MNKPHASRRVFSVLVVVILPLTISACGNFTWSERMEAARARIHNCPTRHFWDGETCQPWKYHPTLKDKIPHQGAKRIDDGD